MLLAKKKTKIVKINLIIIGYIVFMRRIIYIFIKAVADILF